MRSEGVINLVLPARQLVEDHAPTDNLLQVMGTSTKEVIEMFLNAWADFKTVGINHPASWGCTAAESFPMVYSHELNARWLVMDIIFDGMEKRIESGQTKKQTDQDRRDAEQVMMSIWNTLSNEIFDLLCELKVSDLQIGQLRFVRWLGDDFMISIPRYRTAQEHDVFHTKFPAVPSSPLCNYGPDRRNQEPV